MPLDEADDTLVVVAALAGFALCLACGFLLPTMGVQQELVMGGGMAMLLLFVVYLMMCPNCGRKAKVGGASMAEGVTPVSVFIVAGSIGVMLGGMFGGTYSNIQWDKM
jgi:hypothetical protein